MAKRDPYTHKAWDGGLVIDAFVDFFKPTDEEKFRDFLNPKTTKTECGKRRTLDRIDNENYTCPECRRLAKRFEGDKND